MFSNMNSSDQTVLCRTRFIVRVQKLLEQAVKKRLARCFAQSSAHGLRSRKKSAPFTAGTVTDLFVPSSATVSRLVVQLPSLSPAEVSSNTKPTVLDEGHKTVARLPEERIESRGCPPIFALAMCPAATAPARVNGPPG